MCSFVVQCPSSSTSLPLVSILDCLWLAFVLRPIVHSFSWERHVVAPFTRMRTRGPFHVFPLASSRGANEQLFGKEANMFVSYLEARNWTRV
jgi:hypothetical protein